MKKTQLRMLDELEKIEIRSPEGEIEMYDYFYFRWLILRKEFSENIESAQDDLENQSFHVFAIFKNKVLGVGRIHSLNKYESQIRYMAVDSDISKNGIGTKILIKLISKAKLEGKRKIVLHSRENAVNFYKKNGFIKVKETHKIFNAIQHYLMEKAI